MKRRFIEYDYNEADYNEAWQLLLKESADNEQGLVKTVKIVDNNNRLNNVYLLISQINKSYHLLVQADLKSQKELINPKAKGIALKYHTDYKVGGDKFYNFIDISCSDKSNLKIFNLIINEILSKISEKNIQPALAVNKTIEKWKRFWDKPLREALSVAEIIGLIGELLFLKQILLMDIQYIHAWQGPERLEKDFYFPDKICEIKTTTQDKPIHTINGINQLDLIPNMDFYIVSILLKREVAANAESVSLPALVSDIEEIIEKEDVSPNDFHRLLIAAGYNLEHSENYETEIFKVSNINVYPIGENTPRMHSALFKEKLNERITKLTYELDFSGLESISLADLLQLPL